MAMQAGTNRMDLYASDKKSTSMDVLEKILNQHHIQNSNCHIQYPIHRNAEDNCSTERINKMNLYRDFGTIDQFAKVAQHPGMEASFQPHRISNFEHQEQQHKNQAELSSQRRLPQPVKNQEIMQQNEEEPELFPEEEPEDDNCLEMVIELDSNNSITLKIKPYDDPLLLAKQFCYCNNIDPKVIQLLSKQIKQLQCRHFDSISSQTGKNNQSVSSLKPRSLGKSSHQHSLTHVTQPIEKENREGLGNISEIGQSRKNKMYQSGFGGEQREQDDGKGSNGQTNANTKRNQLTKNTSYNNTTLLQGNNHHQYNSNTESESVFDRLYRNSITKTKKQLQHQKLQTHKKSEQKLRNYPSCSNPQYQKNSLNQSTTYLQNLSTSNINAYSSSNQNYAPQIKIYEKNTKLQKETRNRNYSIKQELQSMREDQCTLHPQINPLSRVIVEKIREQGEQGEQGAAGLRDSHVRLYRQSEKSKDKSLAKMISYQKKKQETQMQECTFHPKILKKSKMQTLNTSRFLLLHEDHYIRESKAKSVKASEVKKINQRHHPEINEVSKKIVKDRCFEQRMVEYKMKSEQKHEKIQKQSKAGYSHTPQINSTTHHRSPTIPIGQYLHQKSLQKLHQPTPPTSTKPKINKSSTSMYKQMKKNAFRYIFTLMDSDQDGYISALKVNILGLPVQVLQMLAPLLCQMEEVGVQLDQEEFVAAIDRLFYTFTVHEKNVVLNVYKNPMRKSRAQEQPSFHPSLNEKSMELAREIREPGCNLYEMARQKEAQREAKLSQIRALKALMEIEECTFHPNIIYHH